MELKAVEAYEAISYLKATRLSLGLLINFNMPIRKDGIRRIVEAINIIKENGQQYDGPY